VREFAHFFSALSFENVSVLTPYSRNLVSMSSRLTTSTSASLAALISFYPDLLTSEKTPQVIDLWHWHRLKPQLGPQTTRRKIEVCTHTSYLYAIPSESVFFFQCHSHYLVAVEIVVLQAE
jgi:hypothetical protein